jgi:hypothetical protein
MGAILHKLLEIVYVVLSMNTYLSSKIRSAINSRSIACVVIFFCLFLFQPNTVLVAGELIATSTSFSGLKGSTNGMTGLYSIMKPDAKDTNLNDKNNGLIVVGVQYKDHSVLGINALQNKADRLDEDDDDIVPAIIGEALVYPNPFRQSTTNGAELYYVLSKNMDLEIQVYNMLAQRVFKNTFIAGSKGAAKGENRLNINRESFGGSNNLLSSGIYFFVFIHNGKVLAKTKVAVKP